MDYMNAVMVVAVAHFNLTPIEAWQTTPAEFEDMAEGHAERLDYQRSHTAWWLAHILTAWTKKGKKIKPTDIYKSRRGNDATRRDAD